MLLGWVFELDVQHGDSARSVGRMRAGSSQAKQAGKVEVASVRAGYRQHKVQKKVLKTGGFVGGEQHIEEQSPRGKELVELGVGFGLRTPGVEAHDKQRALRRSQKPKAVRAPGTAQASWV